MEKSRDLGKELLEKLKDIAREEDNKYPLCDINNKYISLRTENGFEIFNNIIEADLLKRNIILPRLNPNRISRGLIQGIGFECLIDDNVVVGHSVIGDRVTLLNGVAIGDNVVIKKGCTIESRANIIGLHKLHFASMFIGSNVIIGSDCIIQASIGNDCKISDEVSIVEMSSIGNDNIIGKGSSITNSRIGSNNTLFDRFNCNNVDIGKYNILGSGVSLGEKTRVNNFNIISEGVKVGGHSRINNNSVIKENVRIGDYVTIGEGDYSSSYSSSNPSMVFIGKGAIIGNNVTIGHNVYIGPYVRIGSNVSIKSFAKIESNSEIMDNVSLESEAVLRSHSKVGEGITIWNEDYESYKRSLE